MCLAAGRFLIKEEGDLVFTVSLSTDIRKIGLKFLLSRVFQTANGWSWALHIAKYFPSGACGCCPRPAGPWVFVALCLLHRTFHKPPPVSNLVSHSSSASRTASVNGGFSDGGNGVGLCCPVQEPLVPCGELEM